MIAQLKSEWYKLRHSRLIFGMIISFVLLLAYDLFLISGGHKVQVMQIGTEDAIGNVIGFMLNTPLLPGVENAAYIQSYRTGLGYYCFFWIIAMMVAVLFYTREYTSRTIRLNVAYGMSSTKLYFSKIILIELIFGILYLVFVTIVFFQSSLFMHVSLTASEIGNFYKFAILSYLVLMVFMQTCIMISTLVKNIGISILIGCLFIFLAVITYPMYFDRMADAALPVKIFLYSNPMYYWLSISAYSFLDKMVIQSLLYFVFGSALTILVTCVVLSRQEIK